MSSELTLDSAVEWAGTAWNVVVDVFEQSRIVDMWQWLLTNPAAIELGGFTGVLWTALAWNLMFLVLFDLVGKLHPKLKWVLLVVYLFFSAGLFVLADTTSAVVETTRTIPGTNWIGEQVLIVWLFVFLALFVLIIIIGHFSMKIAAIAWILNFVLLWIVYLAEWSIYSTEPTIWGLCVMGIISGLWIAVNMLPGGEK